MNLGFQPVNITARISSDAVHPSTGTPSSPWGMPLQIALLFPKLAKEQQKLMMEQELNLLEEGRPRKN
jgi:hypothetical protein